MSHEHPNVPPESPDPCPEGLISDTVDVATIAPAAEGEAAVAAGILPATKPRSAFRRGLEVFLENRLAVAGVGIFVFMVLFCFVGPHVYHANQTHGELRPTRRCRPAPGIRWAPTRTGTTCSAG